MLSTAIPASIAGLDETVAVPCALRLVARKHSRSATQIFLLGITIYPPYSPLQLVTTWPVMHIGSAWNASFVFPIVLEGWSDSSVKEFVNAEI